MGDGRRQIEDDPADDSIRSACLIENDLPGKSAMKKLNLFNRMDRFDAVLVPKVLRQDLPEGSEIGSLFDDQAGLLGLADTAPASLL